MNLYLTGQISAEFGQKGPSSGLGPGPGPGGGVRSGTRQRSRSTGLPVKAAPRTTITTNTTTNARTSAKTPVRTPAAAVRSTPPLSTSPAVVSNSRARAAPPAKPTEIFFLNVEEGYFGCQVNESTDVLQLYDISKLCNGVPECFLGSDENRAQLKCTSEFILKNE